MANPPGTPSPGPPVSPPAQLITSLPSPTTPTLPEEAPVKEVPPPPKDVFPCGCPYPGDHKTDCMWSLWEQMKDNYLQTKTLMTKFMSQANNLQTADPQRPPCDCPPSCHARDLGDAMGLQQMQGVTVPWQQPLLGSTATPLRSAMQHGQQEYSVESEARTQMEEQRRIKNTWAQFLNIFDMALDLANDVSKDRWEAAKRRKERARLEREQRLEEQRRERRERGLTEKEPDDKTKEKKQQEKEKKTKEKPEAESKTKEKQEAESKTKEEQEAESKPKDKEKKIKEEEKGSDPQDTPETSKQDEVETEVITAPVKEEAPEEATEETTILGDTTTPPDEAQTTPPAENEPPAQ